MKLIYALSILLFISLAASAPDEAYGRVVKVVDGDTFDIQLQDSQLSEDLIRVRLADIDCPETRGPKACEAGENASAYTRTWLQSTYVFLDLDDKTGKDQYDRWVAVVYMANPDGSVDTSKNFNQMLVDSGNACIWDFLDNEFDPADWWSGSIPADACIKSSDSSLSQPYVGSTSGWASSGNDAKASTGSQNYLSQGTSTSNSGQKVSSNGPFVGSAKSDKYHYPSCSAAKKIKSSNLVTFSSSAEAKGAGYVSCKICHPP